MDAILLRSLPVSDPESLVVLNWHAKSAEWGKFVMHSISGSTYDDPKSGGTRAGIFPYPAFELFQRVDSVFSSVFAYHPAHDLNLIFNGNADLESGEYVSGDYFRGLGIVPAAGRLILPDDDRIGAQPVAVINFALSERRFGGPANAVGQRILINNLPFVVAGVTPPGFFGVDPGAAPDVFFRYTRICMGRVRADTRIKTITGHRLWGVFALRLSTGSSPDCAGSDISPMGGEHGWHYEVDVRISQS